jgi:hypothetical protein
MMLENILFFTLFGGQWTKKKQTGESLGWSQGFGHTT